MRDFSEFRKSLEAIDHYVYALCEIKEDKRIPFYIGKGVKDRCLKHLKEQGDSSKQEAIQKLLSKDRLGIDILRHGIKTDQSARLIEATCIDLLGIGELTNKVRGSGSEMGRATIEEIHNLQSGELIEIDTEHQGLAFLLNATYKSGMSEIELFEATSGVWKNIPRDESINFAYATYGGLIKEVYQIHSWVLAGTQQYFTRNFESRNISQRWEFVGRKAPQEIRLKYRGKVIKKERSFGNPFVKVGF
ncbi:MAG: hypothetical protein COB04_15090 [Gammaproteobacteria bacterium]|nr:MAG: hypothetical protein COB04_15090 [Gammaproteobacteria bacterium]